MYSIDKLRIIFSIIAVLQFRVDLWSDCSMNYFISISLFRCLFEINRQY